jgi:hypothetical protein
MTTPHQATNGSAWKRVSKAAWKGHLKKIAERFRRLPHPPTSGRFRLSLGAVKRIGTCAPASCLSAKVWGVPKTLMRRAGEQHLGNGSGLVLPILAR